MVPSRAQPHAASEAAPAGMRLLSGRGGLLGPVVPSFRALSGRLKFTVRRHKFNKDSLPLVGFGLRVSGSASGVLGLGCRGYHAGVVVLLPVALDAHLRAVRQVRVVPEHTLPLRQF